MNKVTLAVLLLMGSSLPLLAQGYDGDAEYRPRALSAAPPRRQSHCRAADASRESMTQIRVRHVG